MKIFPVILSGGAGTRLWPLSVPECPKQFLPLVSDRTMIQETLLRLDGLETANPVVICNESHRFLVAQQLEEILSGKRSFDYAQDDKVAAQDGRKNCKPAILLEPLPRNTAPAIAVGAWQALKLDPDAVMVVLSSDHVIEDKAVFQKAVLDAVKEAKKGSLVTFGIVPTCPHTGYGYIKAGASENEQDVSYPIEAFVEKPDLETAEKYLAEGSYSWNSGMFVFKAKTFLDELAAMEPEMAALSRQAFENAAVDQDFIRINREAFEKIKGNSIDYAVMERTSKGRVIKLDAGWNDVGSWQALWEISGKDNDGNASKSKTVLLNSKNSYFNAKKTVAAIGVEDLVVVESDSTILICKRDQCQDVKKIADMI
ncbi:MAG: mannose-1-phosphate guanylyltransferase/mannose-6-phosphate isomerase [Treponema sp.]|nr:mannose-1-phosphate guanylyltransferase/mannose-6-phosphate isomerase [Treponema sp.]